MSRATKTKHVTKEVLEDLVEPTDTQEIVKVEGGCGNNLHRVVAEDGRQFLVSMPRKFRRNVWIKRGDFVVVEGIAEGRKVQAEIVHILFPRQIKHLKEENMWPAAFYDKKHSSSLSTPQSAVLNKDKITESMQRNVKTEEQEKNNNNNEEEEDTNSSGDDDLFVNTNRPHFHDDDNDDFDDDDLI